MKLLQNLNWYRIVLFLRKDLLDIWRIAGIVMLMIASYMLLVSHIGALHSGENRWDYWSGLTMIGWPLWLIVTSLAFAELGNKERTEDFLLLPVSPAEKFIVRMLTVSVILPLAFVLFYSATALLVGVSLWLLYGLSPSFGGILLDENLKLIGEQWVFLLLIQSVFFVGAVWFKKWHLLRTILALLLIGIGMSVFLGFIASLLFSSYNGQIKGNILQLSSLLQLSSRLWKYLGQGLGILLSLSCWWLAWLRFREAQSSDGI